jgi:hypothetical protein
MESEDDFRTVEAVLEDISPLGACVQVEERIPLGATISISAHSSPANTTLGAFKEPARFSGHVSYCAYRDYGYFVGVRFSDETKWSSGVFEPRHLTNLALLSQTGDSASAEELSP